MADTTTSAAAQADLLSHLKKTLKKIQIEDGETSEELYRVEGDMLLDEDQLEIYAQQREALERERALQKERAALGAGDVAPQEGRSSLVGVTANGKLVRWKPGLVLTYCVLKNTFASEDRYNKAVAELDGSATTKPNGVLFTVREIDAGGQFIASAFFPNDPKNRRRVLIDPSYFDPNLSFDAVGVLRHELGHVLGFRHEHIRSQAPPSCPDETLNDTLDLTQYDPQSVMHYFCGGVGSKELAITETDRIGAQVVYGPPLAEGATGAESAPAMPDALRRLFPRPENVALVP
jgi:hypothetical protein